MQLPTPSAATTGNRLQGIIVGEHAIGVTNLDGQINWIFQLTLSLSRCKEVSGLVLGTPAPSSRLNEFRDETG